MLCCHRGCDYEKKGDLGTNVAHSEHCTTEILTRERERERGVACMLYLLRSVTVTLPSGDEHKINLRMHVLVDLGMQLALVDLLPLGFVTLCRT